MELIGLYLVACTLLVVAGTAKAVRPAETARALADIVPVSQRAMRLVVRTGSIAEAGLGLVALLSPRPVSAGLVALSYAVFAGFVAYARIRGRAIASCGCFGTPDTPATWVHVVVDVGLAVAALCVAIAAPTGSLLSLLARQPGHGLPLIVISALCAWLTYLSIAVLADLQAARRLTAISFRSES
jgi:Methylamine utilisation protein MauE